VIMIMQQELKQYLHYDLNTGHFTRLKNLRNGRKAGEVITNTDANGYLRTKIEGVTYKLHQLAFLYVKGYMPKGIDHKNHIKNDNAWGNLREATQQENDRNHKLHSNNVSGFNGVNWNKNAKRWRASISVSGKRKHLGSFTEKEDAILVRKEANIKYGFYKNHGLTNGEIQ